MNFSIRLHSFRMLLPSQVSKSGECYRVFSISKSTLFQVEKKKQLSRKENCLALEKECLPFANRMYSSPSTPNVEIRPTQIKYQKKNNILCVTFNNGKQFAYSPEFLRVHSPSAEVQGHTSSQRKLVSNKKKVTIITLEAVGNYAIRIIFDDLHETGIYTWTYLYELGKNKMRLMRKYIKELNAKGRTRDPIVLKHQNKT